MVMIQRFYVFQPPKATRQKKQIFYSQADRKGGGGSHLDPDRKQMWKLWPIFFTGIWLYDTQNTFYLIVKSLKNAF